MDSLTTVEAEGTPRAVGEADSQMLAAAEDIRPVAGVAESPAAVAPKEILAEEEAAVEHRSGPRPEAALARRSVNRYRIDSRTGSRAHSWSRSWDT